MWKKKKKGNEQVTLIIIPSTTAKPYSMSLPQKQVRRVGGAIVLSILVLVIICISFYMSRAEIRSINNLKADNLRKQQTIEQINSQFEKIEKQQKNLIKKQNDIKKQMGLECEGTASPTPSRGSEAPYEQASQAADNISNRAQYINQQLYRQEIEINNMLAKVERQTAYYRSLPNQWPVDGEISSPYGWRKSPFTRRNESFHDGIDIKNGSGAPVVAAGDGIVTFAGWKAVYGRTLEIQHNCGLTSKYGHNSSLLVKKGEQVTKGQIIARVGTSGLSTGPHLHFSVLKGDTTQDPMIYLPETDEGGNF